MEALGSATAAETRDQFLQLLVTQLRNQDPLEPTKQEDFMQQLAQFSTLEGIEKMNTNLTSYMDTQTKMAESQQSFLLELQQFQNVTNASSLVGKQVTYQPIAKPVDSKKSKNEEVKAPSPKEGVVEAVVVQNKAVKLRINKELIDLSQMREITES